MGARRLTAKEASATRSMAEAKLRGGEEPASVVAHLALYLTARGWLERPALTRARGVVRVVLESPRGDI